MYLLLASNCNKEIYGDVNQANHFYVDLPTEIQLDGPHAIALREIFYNGYIPTIINEEIRLYYLNLIDYKLFYEPYKKKLYNNLLEISGFEANDLTVTFDSTVELFIYQTGMKIKSMIKTNVEGFEEIPGEIKEHNLLNFHKTLTLTKKQLTASRKLRIEIVIISEPLIVKLPSVKHMDVRSLVSSINAVLKYNGIVFGYRNDHVFLKSKPDGCGVELGNGLHELLGFERKMPILNVPATYKAQLSRGIYTMFVYMNIVESAMVGDAIVPLLKVINYEKRDDPNVHIVIDNPQYMPINRQTLKNLEIQICSDTGELIPFAGGKTSLLVEIKKL